MGTANLEEGRDGDKIFPQPPVPRYHSAMQMHVCICIECYDE